MNAMITQLLAEAIKLPVDDRVELVDRIWESIEPPESDIDQLTNEELEAELNRRRDELIAHPERGIPCEKALEMMKSDDG